ncbi:MAG: sugar transferase [Acidimicrobiales bacterium]|nr:sugar transferase [Acidimicrobiales bacterium]
MNDVTQPSAVARRLYLRLWHGGFRWLYVVDALGVFLVLVVVMAIRFGMDWPEPAASWTGIVVATVLVQVVFYFGGLYEKQMRLGQRMWFSRVAGLTLVGLAVSALLVLPTGRYPVPRANLPAVGVLVALIATGSRGLSRRLRAGRFGPPRVLLVGSDEQTLLAAEHLDESDRDAVVAARVFDGGDLLGHVDRHGATDVVFVDDVVVEDLFPEPAGTLDVRGVGAYLRVTATSALMGLREVREIGGMPYVALPSRALRPHQMRLKRLVELVVVVAVSPLVLAVAMLVTLWLRAVAGRGVVLRQRRVGRGGRPFTLMKFRTMAADAENDGGARLADRDDQRVLRGCGWLRSTRLDELPQFWNVVRGEMSLVGPRPERPELVAQFEAAIPGYGRRHEIPPGITGLAQTRSGYHTDPAYKLGHDLQYLMSWSPILDAQILVRTLLVMVRRRS